MHELCIDKFYCYHTTIVACSFSISPHMERSTFRVALTFDLHQNNSDVERAAVTLMSDNISLTTATVTVVTTGGINQPVNGSFCQIKSLEVYRGTRSITKISHDGFSFSNEGIFMVVAFDE